MTCSICLLVINRETAEGIVDISVQQSSFLSIVMLTLSFIWGFPAPSFRFALLQPMEQDTWEMFGQSLLLLIDVPVHGVGERSWNSFYPLCLCVLCCMSPFLETCHCANLLPQDCRSWQPVTKDTKYCKLFTQISMCINSNILQSLCNEQL